MELIVLAALLLVVLALSGGGLVIVLKSQANLTGRLTQMADTEAAAQSALADRMQAQERALAKTLDDRIADLGKRVGDNLQQSATESTKALGKLQERMAVIDAAQKNLTELSRDMVGLQDILSNKQARGAFGELQLGDLVANILPPSAYDMQVSLSNGRRVDCLLRMPNPPGPIAIDAKFPLESFHALQAAEDGQAKTAAERRFRTDVSKHVTDIAERYILPGETAEWAVMFLPSEAVFAELHAGFPDVIEKSFKAKVGIVSPTTMMATLNTVRAVLKDAKMREQAGLIQKEVATLMGDIGRLDDRVGKLHRHFDLANDDIRQIRISTEKIVSRGEKIDTIEFENGDEGEGAPGGTLPDNVEKLEPGRGG